MRSLVSKYLRREALQEMMRDGVPKRDLVQKKSGEVINSPQSIRHLYLNLKRAYVRVAAGMSAVWSYNVARAKGLVKQVKERGRRRSKIQKPQPDDRIMTIQKPLMLILQHCQPSPVRDAAGVIVLDPLTKQPTYVPHPVYASARRAADRGRGDLVQKMARQFLPS